MATNTAGKRRSGGSKTPPARGTLTRTRVKRMIAKLLDALEKDEGSPKPSISELTKLIQLYNDMTAETVKEVEVRWVDRLGPAENEKET